MKLDTALIEGLAPEKCLERALLAERVVDLGNLVSGFYWGEIRRRGVYVELGHSSFRKLIRSRSHESVRTIDERIKTAGEVVGLPKTLAAFEAGELKWAAVRAIAPVATLATEGAWVEWSIGKPTDLVAANAAHREKGELPTDPRRQRIHSPRAYRGAKLNAAELDLFERVRAMVESVHGQDVTDRELIVFLISLVARMRPDGSIPGWKAIADKPYLLHLNQDAGGRLFVNGHDGEPVPIDLATLVGLGSFPIHSKQVADALHPLDADRVGLPLLDPENSRPLTPEDQRDIPTPPALRNETLARDGYRCRICGSCENLAAHHRRWRSYGGRTALSNLLTACEKCHSLIHARLLIVLGDPEGELRFLDREGQPTERRTSTPVEIPLVRAPDARLDRGPQAPPAPTVRLEDVIGQDELRARLGTAIEAAGKRGDMPPHLVLCGEPGVGKSFMAEALAGELGAPLLALPAPRVKTSEELLQALIALRPGAVLFMDELHALPRSAAEGVLYEALDRGTVTIPLPEGGASRARTVKIAPFTFVGATTHEDQLPRPLLSRLSREQLYLYSEPALAELLRRTAAKHGLQLEPEAAARLAHASRDTPRQGLALLRGVRDAATLAERETIDAALVERALTARGIDADGFDPIDRAYLEELARARGPRSLSTLAARLGVSEARLAAVHEPFLIRRGRVLITSQGRVLACPGG